MSDTPKEVWLIWEGGLVTAWDDEKSPSRKAKHYLLDTGTLRETEECIWCDDYPPGDCDKCQGTKRRVKP